MFEKFKNITIKGGYFEQPITLQLFKDSSPLCIVYGRNGSGKTSIARALRQYVGKDVESQTEDGNVPFIISTGEAIPEDKKDSVFIFDEEFVRDNIRTKGEGLETIIMMGDQVNLDMQLSEKVEIKKNIEKKIADLNILKEKFENKNNTSSPFYFLNKIKNGLREDGSWADIDCKIRGNAIKSRVTDDLVGRFVSMAEPQDQEDGLRDQLNKDLVLFTQTKDAQTIPWSPMTLSLPENLNGLQKLLEKKIEKPILSEREVRLLSFLQEHSEHHFQETTRQLANEKWAFCPLCLRETGKEDFEHISDTLKRILNKEAEKYGNTLDESMLIFRDVEFKGSLIPLDKEKQTVQVAADQLNKDLSGIRDIISLRKRNIYGLETLALNEDIATNYSIHLSSFKGALDVLETRIVEFNCSVNERNKLRNKIIQENELLARKKLSDLLDGYNKASKSYKTCLNALFSLEKDRLRVEDAIHSLKSQIMRTDIALDYINDELQYVFYSDKKVKLTAGNGYYILKINGKNVPPRKISVGERNVLGLCYFFAKLFSNKKKDNKYKDELLIIVDDPVSSFDYGNRLGVMSLLRHQFNSIKEGNANSRMLVMTHDLRTAFDLVKVRSELKDGKGSGDRFLELSNKHLIDRKISNEYGKLLEAVYKYAKNSSEVEDEYSEMGIGNVMRRLMEAFSSFCYNKSFEEMMCHRGILKAIPDEKRSYYENFMCRLILNGESHTKEGTYSLNYITPYLTRKEKIQTAKSILLFLWYLNKEHLCCYLDNEEIMDDINNWKEEELTWMT